MKYYYLNMKISSLYKILRNFNFFSIVLLFKGKPYICSSGYDYSENTFKHLGCKHYLEKINLRNINNYLVYETYAGPNNITNAKYKLKNNIIILNNSTYYKDNVYFFNKKYIVLSDEMIQKKLKEKYRYIKRCNYKYINNYEVTELYNCKNLNFNSLKKVQCGNRYISYADYITNNIYFKLFIVCIIIIILFIICNIWFCIHIRHSYNTKKVRFSKLININGKRSKKNYKVVEV